MHWHNHNPWKDSVVYVTLEELAECVAGGNIRLTDGSVVPYTSELILSHWRQCGAKLDPYILPQPSGMHDIGVRYGPEDSEYISPYARNQGVVARLLMKYRSNADAV